MREPCAYWRKEDQTKATKTQVSLALGQHLPLVTLDPDGRVYLDWLTKRREVTISLPAGVAHRLAAEVIEATRDFCDNEAGA